METFVWAELQLQEVGKLTWKEDIPLFNSPVTIQIYLARTSCPPYICNHHDKLF